MSKTQRELLILGGILGVLAVILLLRFGGGEEEAPVPAGEEQPVPTRPLTRGEMMRGEGGGTPTASQIQGELARQLPMDLVVPGLSDSAVTARIAAGGVPDPFSELRGPVRRTTRSTPQPTSTRSPRAWRQETLSDWPSGLDFQGLIPVMGEPGVYAAQFNNHSVRVGEKIPGTDWELREASRLLVRLYRRDESTRTEYSFQYIIPPLLVLRAGSVVRDRPHPGAPDSDR
ncbi:MAG: hypothetical protein R6W82_08970 [bacterium]